MLLGGFHLVAADDTEIARVVTLLHDTYKVECVAPGHCTGEATFAALKKGFGDHALYAGLGTVFALGAKPRAMTELLRPQRDSNPRYSLERAVSWAGLDDGDPERRRRSTPSDGPL